VFIEHRKREAASKSDRFICSVAEARRMANTGCLASDHKNLRFCDLCKELAFGSPDALRQNQDFIQLVRAQNVLPPVPGEAR
jgi:hypothetical protein